MARLLPKLLSLIPILLSVSSCDAVPRIGSVVKPEIPNLKGSAVPDSYGFALDCSGNIAEDLAEVGPPSSIYYEVWNEEYPPSFDSPCDDLRLKIFVALHPHPDYATSNLARLTVIRTDNVLQKKGADVGKGALCPPLDREWMNQNGWSTPLNIRICPSDNIGEISDTSSFEFKHPREDPLCQSFVIPPINDLGDSYQEDLLLPGLIPVPKLTSDVPRIIFRVTHDAWDDRALILDKVGVIIRILNPDYDMREIVATEISDTAEEFGGKRGRNLVDALQPIAFKVDVLRLLFLEAVGGVYLDSKVFPQRPLDTILPEKGGFLPWDRGHKGIWNGIMALPKGDPLPRIALEMIERNIKTHFYGSGSLTITGPILVGEALDEALQQWISKNVNSRKRKMNKRGAGEYISRKISLTPKSHQKTSPYSTYSALDPLGIFIITDDSENSSQYGNRLIPPVPIFNVHNIEYRRRMTSDNFCHYSNIWALKAVYYEKTCDPKLGLLDTRI
jgi:mannosyltransferase OCH1-like enzyme